LIKDNPKKTKVKIIKTHLYSTIHTERAKLPSPKLARIKPICQQNDVMNADMTAPTPKIP
jgi:hypothetical protein